MTIKYHKLFTDDKETTRDQNNWHVLVLRLSKRYQESKWRSASWTQWELYLITKQKTQWHKKKNRKKGYFEVQVVMFYFMTIDRK